MIESWVNGGQRSLGARAGRISVASALAAATMALSLVFAPTAPAHAREAPTSFADLAEKLSPAVVNIATTQQVSADKRREVPRAPPGSSLEEFFREFFDRQQRQGGGQPRRMTSLGSGFVIDAAGYIVTNNHVIQDAEEITVYFSDESSLKATVVGKDAKTDLALLKVEVPKGKKLTIVKFGDSDKARIGDWVMAIGNPFGLGGTVTAGILSARARDINTGQYDDFLQTDASINQGNSGGPLFNMDGEVVGVNTAIYSPTGGSVGIGFAIPANLAKGVIAQLREFGRTRRGWLGVQIQSVDEDVAKSMNLDKPQGALISRVTKGGPADLAKILPRDVILTFDGKEITDMRRLPRVVAETPVGKEVDVVVWRDDRKITLRIKVAEAEETDKVASTEKDKPLRAPTVESFGLTLARLSSDLRERYNIPDTTKGVLVTRVAEGSVSAEKGIRAGDVIVDINQNEIKTPEDFVKRVKEAQDQKRKSVLILLDRQGDLRFVALRIDG